MVYYVGFDLGSAGGDCSVTLRGRWINGKFTVEEIVATQHDDVEVEGVLIDTTPKSYKFQGDYWDKPEFVPISQSELVMQPNSETPGKAILYIRRWLCKKNGWCDE